MGATWGTAEGHLQVGVEAWTNSPSPGDTFVTVQLRVYCRIPPGDNWSFNDSQRITVTGNSGTNHVFTNNLSGAGATRLLHSASFNASIDNNGGPTYSWTATVSEMYNGGTPSASKSITLPAKVGSVPAAPNPPVITNLQLTACTASWNAPNNGGSAIDHYSLHASTNPSFTNTAWANLPSLTSQSVTGLSPNTTYYIRVAAHNALGYGPPSGTTQFTTLAEETPTEPGEPPAEEPSFTPSFQLLPTAALRTAAVLDLHDVGQYDDTALYAALRAPARTLRYRYQVLTKDMESKGFVDCIVEGGSIDYNFLADVKRTASFPLAELGDFNIIDFISDRVRVHWQLKMPDGLWATWPVGTFVFHTPRRNIKGSVVTREVVCSDLTYILQKAKNRYRWKAPAGANVVEEVRRVIDGHPSWLRHEIPDNPEVLASALSWDPGTTSLRICNELLAKINYRSIFADADGTLRSGEYVVPQDRDIEETYDATDPNVSLLGEDSNLLFDLSDVANRFAISVSQPDRPVLTAIYENNSPDSPTSIPNRGYIIADVRTDPEEDAPTQDTLDAKVRRIAHEASQVFEEFEFNSAAMPTHGENTVLQINYPQGDIVQKYSETQWSLPLRAGQYMKHTVRRVVDLEAA